MLLRDGNANVVRTGKLEFFLDSFLRKLRPVTIAAKMREDDVPELTGDNFTNYGGGIVITQVAVPAHDSLFCRPRTNRVILQQFQVVVGFQNDHVNIANPFDDEFCGVTEVGNEGDGVRGVAESEADRIAGVVRNAEWFDGKVANFKGTAGGKEPPRNPDTIVSFNFFGGEPVGVNRNRGVFADDSQRTGVVGMFVRQENGVNVGEAALNTGKPLGDLPVAQTGVHEEGGLFGFDERAVTGAAAAKNCDLNSHGGTLQEAAPVSSGNHSIFTCRRWRI